MVYSNVIVAVTAIGALLSGDNLSGALSSANLRRAPFVRHRQCRCLTTPLRGLVSDRHLHLSPMQLMAVAENVVAVENPPETNGSDSSMSSCTTPTVTVIAGPGARITSVSSGTVVEKDLWGKNMDGEGFVKALPSPPNTMFGATIKEDRAVVECNLFPCEVIQEVGSQSIKSNILAEIKDEIEGCCVLRSSRARLGVDKVEKGEKKRECRDRTDNSEICSTFAKKCLPQRAVITENAKIYARSTGQSSHLKPHGNKGRKKAGSTVGDVTANKILTENAVHSTVAHMLEHQDAFVKNQNVPSQTTSIGVLGDVVQEKLPDIPPLSGAYLVQSGREPLTRGCEIHIRSSIPHSVDDTHIANLRLSVFSGFDEAQQKVFRCRSIEVLNMRRRRGAVVLVAEVPGEAVRENGYSNEMQARIANGHKYEDGSCDCADKPNPSCSSTVLIASARNSYVRSVPSGATEDENGDCVVENKENAPKTMVRDRHTSKVENPSIIGSVECSHQEFRDTMLGNSRRKGSLMYVTEVAVQTNSRRCGTGSMLMKGVDKVAALRNVETIYLHVDVTNRAACAMYERCGYNYLDKRKPIYAQFTASLNLHDGAMHGRKHYLMCKDIKDMCL